MRLWSHLVKLQRCLYPGERVRRVVAVSEAEKDLRSLWKIWSPFSLSSWSSLPSYWTHTITIVSIMALNISLPSPQVLRRGSSRRDLFTTVRLSGWKLCSPQMCLQRLCFSVMTVTKPMLPMLMVFNRLPMAFASITQRHWDLLRKRMDSTHCIVHH